MLPSTVVLDHEDAVRYLVAQAKPVSCRAKLSQDSLTVLCQPLSGWQRGAHDKVSAEMGEWLRTTVGSDAQGGSDVLVDLRGIDESLVLSVSDLLELFRDFDVPWAASLVPADESALMKGAVATCVVSAGADWRTEGPAGTVFRSAPPK